jgi:hypothetical protein
MVLVESLEGELVLASGIFDRRDHLHQSNGKRDHL